MTPWHFGRWSGFSIPRRIAILGVTINPNSVGGKVLGNLVGGGYRGVVYPVNPDSEAVLGIQCYPDVRHLPKTPDLAVICSPAPSVPEQVRECGEAGIRGIVIMSAGFRESGPEGAALEEGLVKEARQFDGMRIIGPNCLGFIVPGAKLNVSFASGMPNAGPVASEDAIYDAAFQRAGMARVYDIGDIFDVVELIGGNGMPKGDRLGIVTNAGGPGVMATDALIAANGVLAGLSAKTMARLNEVLPPAWSHRNPVDVLGDARSKRLAAAARIVLEDLPGSMPSGKPRRNSRRYLDNGR